VNQTCERFFKALWGNIFCNEASKRPGAEESTQGFCPWSTVSAVRGAMHISENKGVFVFWKIAVTSDFLLRQSL
jgi:hypothetical protein